MQRVRTLIIFGTRPEAIKMAPVVRECLRRSDAIAPIVCRTGQHREMLDQVTDYFGIRADVELDIMTTGQTLASLTSRSVEGIDAVIARHQPDCVMGQGDTTTAMTSALAAFYRRTPFVHVEAGLRTGDLYAPWPEEMNRRVASLAARLHCPPTRLSRDNLVKEGVSPDVVHITGNTVIDALQWTVRREREMQDHWNRKHGFAGDAKMVLITGHRRENFGTDFENICRAIRTLADRFAEIRFVYPVHLNPHVQQSVHRILGDKANVHLLQPAAYPEFVWLMDRSSLILTDSGGVQEEAPSLRKPILVMRDTTERPEALEAGAVELVGTSPERIIESVSRLLNDGDEYRRRQIDYNPYGAGRAAQRIVNLVADRAWDV